MRRFQIFLFFCFISCSHQKNFTNKNDLPLSSRYSRSEWKHWIDADGNCLNTRNELLRQRSLSPVKFNKNGCLVKKGLWKDYYFPEILSLSSQIDVDHLVPLKHAHISGGGSWSRAKKQMFANDLENLVITNKKYNRQKGAKSIDQWLPLNKSFACKYVKDWKFIKKKYSLTIFPAEVKTINLLRKHCH